ncbi:hypothetical protein HFP70_03230 [Streptomyces sp. ARC14]|uniref:hypothetical protein n=1 Tax=Streptomyces sp. ARC14 TaxID=2724152 RepID=UPI003857BB9B
MQQFEQGRRIRFPQYGQLRIQPPGARAKDESQRQQQQTQEWLNEGLKPDDDHHHAAGEQHRRQKMNCPRNGVRGCCRAPDG